MSRHLCLRCSMDERAHAQGYGCHHYDPTAPLWYRLAVRFFTRLTR